MRVRRNFSLWSMCVFIVAIAIVITAVNPAYGQGAGEEMEKEAQAIDKMIMCPVCPAETIDQAQVEISFQMRALIREMLAEGRTRGEILDYFVDRYGADILAAPPKSGSNLLAWILPIVGVAAGLVGVFFVIRSMTGRQRAAPVTAAVSATPLSQQTETGEDPELAPYLEITDRLLASRRAPSAAGISSSEQGATDETPQSRSGRLNHQAGSDTTNG